MRNVVRLLARFYWEDITGTLLGSVIIVLISLFFANFDNILPLYDPLATNVPNSHQGMITFFQIILWPALVSTVVTLLTGSFKLAIKLRNRIVNPKNQEKSQSDLPSPGSGQAD